ncbi:MAG TPA: OmpA family protein [Gemmatimonadaceae bacterium]|jgi:outer membrane protein OmpA-like peptidoglycan-associated protein|nr:OmpA family protein [Gemmatimonadaceae bacterium]
MKKMKYANFRTTAASLLAAGMLVSAGCASMNQKERGAVIGAGAGAAIGGVIGNQTGSTARGAIIGAVVGGAAGAIIGHQMDQQAKELDQSIPGAKVERVGEGIEVTFDSGLLFDFDSDRIRPDAAKNFQELANSLTKFGNSNLLIVGHTDSQGEDAYNMNLSQRRANSASAYLQSLGVPASRISTAGRGEAEPVATNDTDAGRQLNRRVEVAIYASPEYREQVKKSSSGQ